ncbi:roadblock/LC7 domain-containing protein [Deinococcus taeanensis]|uniref:roadblock/LC7 domain-containing protein n=1 Tax=Deinococcus taeanensis TaxID=2737050 RepID=UPI001CDBC6F2|nr:roadblock/LC7 domain-containing protein [Deinococcus taeanensis]UBV41702.1 roadblock/LC7 domain-containing protein [Deinococcus taeanensis]
MILDPLRTLPGVIAAAVVGPDGLALESHGDGGDGMAAELAALRTQLDRTGRRLGAGEVTRIAFTSERVEVVAVTTGDFILGAAMTRGTDTRTAQQTLARVALDLNLPRPETT